MGHLCLEDIKLNIEEIRKHLKYDPISGIFTRVNSSRRCGSIWANRSGNQYLRIVVGQNRYSGHRIAALLLGLDLSDDNEVDHIDGNGLNNSAVNLRTVSRSDNAKNKRIPINNTSGVIGVHFNKQSNSWRASIRDGKRVTIGNFKDFFEACCARKSAEVRLGFHENHGRPKRT